MSDAVSKPILDVQDVHKSFRIVRTDLHILKGISLSVARGETLCIMGPSGAGKSTLLHIAGGLDRPSKGRILYEGRDIYALSAGQLNRYRGTQIGFVFQAYHLLPELDILENVMLPAMRTYIGRRPPAELRERAMNLLEQVGLTDRAHHRPMELSGGEQQRTAIARALMSEPEVVLADEPTGNLDSRTGDLVLQYLFALTKDQGHTLVLVTHNEAVAERCHRTLVMVDGRLTRG